MRDALNLFYLFLKRHRRPRHHHRPRGHTTTRTYDGLSRLATQTGPMGRLTWFTYDGLDRLTSARLDAAVEPGLLPMDATLTAPAWELTAWRSIFLAKTAGRERDTPLGAKAIAPKRVVPPRGLEWVPTKGSNPLAPIQGDPDLRMASTDRRPKNMCSPFDPYRS